MDSEMGHLCNLRILMAAVKMTIFSGNILFCDSYFCSEHRLWTHVRAKIRQMCTPVKLSCTI